MKKKSILASYVLILLALMLQGCSSPAQNKEVAKIHPAASPSEVSEAFYTWYLGYIGVPASDTFRSPLTDKAYRNSEYLTPGFIKQVDEILAGFDGAGYDPFLCAQDIPTEVKADEVFWQEERASVLMRTNFPNHFLTADLQKTGEGWQIENIVCGSTPVGTAKAFYTWYLGYIGDPATDDFRNPLVDKAYRNCEFLSAAFIQKLDVLTAEGIPADPILMAQAVPQSFTVDTDTEENTAIVHLQFGTETVHDLKIGMISDSGSWKIDSIEKAK